MYHQPEEIKCLTSAARLDPKSFRGRVHKQEDPKDKQEKQVKRAEKKKRQKQRKKERMKEESKREGTLQTEED